MVQVLPQGGEAGDLGGPGGGDHEEQDCPLAGPDQVPVSGIRMQGLDKIHGEDCRPHAGFRYIHRVQDE